jgi:ABC-type multidrug transport system fused ATPase/permease subunit
MLARKLWQLLHAEQRQAAGVMLILMLVGMVLETLGVGLVVPTMALMTSRDWALNYPEVALWLQRFGSPSHESLIVSGMLVLVGVYVVKAIFLAFIAWRQARLVYGLQSAISQRLFVGYLRQPYTFHLQRNSAHLIHNTIGHVGDITAVIQQVMMFLTELFVILGISVLLMAVEPLGALLVVSTFSMAGWGFHRLTRGHILRWGEARQHHEGLRMKHLQQGLAGAKDVKLLGRESDFLAQFRKHAIGSARVGQRQSTILALPRLWMELLAVSGLAALVLTMIWQGKPTEAILPTLGLFAAAAFRLMPSVNRMLGAVQNMRFSLPVVDTLHRELCLLETAMTSSRATAAPLRFMRYLSLERVSFQYPSATTPSLSDVSLMIKAGTSVGFIGGSGAGKSTLVDVILGLLTPTAGTVNVDGNDIQTCLRSWQDLIGYVPQTIFLTDDSIRRNVAFGLPSEQIDDAAVWKALSAAQLDQFVSNLPQELNTVVGERGVRLSGGQRQRIGIARALYHDPAVLVLDEATSSLDTATERDVMDAVRALHGEKTLIIVAHRLNAIIFFGLNRGALSKKVMHQRC